MTVHAVAMIEDTGPVPVLALEIGENDDGREAGPEIDVIVIGSETGETEASVEIGIMIEEVGILLRGFFFSSRN